MLKTRPLLALTVAAAALAGTAAMPALASGVSLTVKRLIVWPKSVSGNGGSVRMRVQVRLKGSTISSVRGQAFVSGNGPGIPSQLESRGNGIYDGTVRVPGNRKRTTASATLVVLVATGNGQNLQRTVEIISVAGQNNDMPPPPPPN